MEIKQGIDLIQTRDNEMKPSISKEKIVDFVILALRWYLVWYMISYGWAKLTMSQFGVSNEAVLNTPLKEADAFYLAWHLYGESQFFNIITGLAEIIGGLLLIFNRTVLLGSLLVLTILAQILIIDISFTMGQHGYALPLRITGMILTALLILYHYKDKLMEAFKTLTNGISTRFSYKSWVFLLLPIIGFGLDFVMAIVMMPIKVLLEWIFPLS